MFIIRPTVAFSIENTQFMYLKLSWNFGHKQSRFLENGKNLWY